MSRKSFIRLAGQMADWVAKSMIDIRKSPALALVMVAPVAFVSWEAYRKAHELYGFLLNEAGTKSSSIDYDSLCSGGGPVFYRKIDAVEGVYLPELRSRPEHAWWDPLWPDAGLPNEYAGDEYIRSFLSTEYAHRDKDWQPIPITLERRGLVGLKLAREQDVTPADQPGYLYVDVPDPVSGEIMRYSLGKTGELLKRKALPPYPRYAVTFVNPVNPEYRSQALASTSIRVVDRETDDLLAEWTVYSRTGLQLLRLRPEMYAWSFGPWGNGMPCPNVGGAEWRSGYRTRLFATMVLKPVGW